MDSPFVTLSSSVSIERGFSAVEISSVDYLPFLELFRAQSGRKSTLNLYAGDNPRSFYANGAPRELACLQLLEHSDATVEHVAVGGIEVAGVPGIGHVAGALGPTEQARNLAVGVVAKDATQATRVLGIHIDNAILVAILRATHLTCAMCDDGNSGLA